MRGRFLFIGIVVFLGGWAASLSADANGVSPSADSAQPGPDSLRLSCTGTMAGSDAAPAQPIVTNGFVDLVGMRVRGFGFGSAPIVILTAARVDFGTVAAAGAAGSMEGSINRLTGETRINLRAPDDPSRMLLSLKLDCRVEPSVS